MIKNTISNLLLLIQLVLVGCNWIGGGENFPPAPDIEHYTIIKNTVQHKIEIGRYYKGELKYPFVLLKDESKSFNNELFDEQLPFFPNIADSVKVIFDATIYVWHTKEEVQTVSRSLLLPSSYSGGKVNDNLYEIYYEFTDADYEEAVRINEGG